MQWFTVFGLAWVHRTNQFSSVRATAGGKRTNCCMSRLKSHWSQYKFCPNVHTSGIKTRRSLNMMSVLSACLPSHKGKEQCNSIPKREADAFQSVSEWGQRVKGGTVQSRKPGLAQWLRSRHCPGASPQLSLTRRPGPLGCSGVADAQPDFLETSVVAF